MAIGGGLALIAALHNPEERGFSRLCFFPRPFFFSIGGVLAGRQIYLQSLPPDLVPSCGPDLDYLLEIFLFLKFLE